MFGELPKLFDRNFVIGYFFPFTILATVSYILLDSLNLFPNWLVDQQVDFLTQITLFGVFAWFGGVLLMIVNRDLIRFLEGYGRLNPLRLLQTSERRRFRNLKAEIQELDDAYAAAEAKGIEFQPAQQAKRARLMMEIVRRFPDQEQWVLPTSLGNTIRAFEVYPRVMYGIDSIPGWPRLLSVLPKEYRDLIDASKARMDFWLNIQLVAAVIAGEVLGLSIYIKSTSLWWVIPLVAAIGWIAYSRSISAAAAWGEYVKAAFDTFLPELCRKLGFGPPITKDQRERFWTNCSQAFTYRWPELLAMQALAGSDANPEPTNSMGK